MTDEQRSRIRKLRTEGVGYKKAAEITGISVNTIKTYCRRNGLSGGEEKAVIRCLCCGAPLDMTPGRRPKKFCNDTCRTRWWSRHRSEHMTGKGVHHFTCAFCGKEFIAYGRKNRKYCCHDCYIRDRFNENYKMEAGSTVHDIPDDLSQMA